MRSWWAKDRWSRVLSVIVGSVPVTGFERLDPMSTTWLASLVTYVIDNYRPVNSSLLKRSLQMRESVLINNNFYASFILQSTKKEVFQKLILSKINSLNYFNSFISFLMRENLLIKTKFNYRWSKWFEFKWIRITVQLFQPETKQDQTSENNIYWGTTSSPSS